MPYRLMLDNYFSSQRPLFSLSERIWNPPTDILETETSAYIKMEVAGLDDNELQISVQGNTLRVRGRRDRCHPENATYHLMEVHFGEFERIFTFPFSLESAQVKANYERGFLMIEIPKSAANSTQVVIQVFDSQ